MQNKAISRAESQQYRVPAMGNSIWQVRKNKRQQLQWMNGIQLQRKGKTTILKHDWESSNIILRQLKESISVRGANIYGFEVWPANLTPPTISQHPVVASQAVLSITKIVLQLSEQAVQLQPDYSLDGKGTVRQ